MIHLEHLPGEFSYHVPPGAEKIILQNYEGEIENCRLLSLMSNVLQGLHIKRRWLKAPLSCPQRCESLNSVMYICTLWKQTKRILASFSGKKKKSIPWEGWLSWASWEDKSSRDLMNQADWQRLPGREDPMGDCIRGFSQAPPFTRLLSICYSFWNPFPLPASLDHPCLPTSLPPFAGVSQVPPPLTGSPIPILDEDKVPLCLILPHCRSASSTPLLAIAG